MLRMVDAPTLELANTRMNVSELANPRILKQPIYRPGKPIEEVAAEHGLDPVEISKLASNENPLGPHPKRSRRQSAPCERYGFIPKAAVPPCGRK